MFIYIILYILLLLITVFDYVEYPYERKKIIIICAVIVFGLFKGLRWETGTDWNQFYMCFENSSWNNIFTYKRYEELDELMEPGYMFANVFIKQFGDYTLFLLCQCFFVCITWAYLSFKLVPNRPIFAFAMAMVFNVIFPIRLPVAGAIVCWAFYFSLKKQYFIALLIGVIAYTMHKSALFTIPFIFFINKELPKWLIWILFGVSLLGEILADHISLLILLISVYLPENLQENVAGYSDAVIHGYSEKSLLSIVMSVSLSFFFVFIFLKTRDLIKMRIKKTHLIIHKRKLIIFNQYFNCYIFMTFFFKFFSSPMLTNFTRVSEYFTLGFAISFVIAYDYLKRYFSEGILYSFFCAYYLYKFYGMMNTPYPEAMFPYKTIFSLW